LSARLRRHVAWLADRIGERNVWRPEALRAAAAYIRGELEALGCEVVAAFRARSRFPVAQRAAPGFVPGVAWSDQLSFWRAGYPAVMVTDTAFYRNPHYHRASDTPARLRYPEMARVVEGLAAAVAALAGREQNRGG